MPTDITCPVCRHRFAAPDEPAVCPVCHTPVSPSAIQPAQTGVLCGPPPESSLPTVACPHCDRPVPALCLMCPHCEGVIRRLDTRTNEAATGGRLHQLIAGPAGYFLGGMGVGVTAIGIWVAVQMLTVTGRQRLISEIMGWFLVAALGTVWGLALVVTVATAEGGARSEIATAGLLAFLMRLAAWAGCWMIVALAVVIFLSPVCLLG